MTDRQGSSLLGVPSQVHADLMEVQRYLESMYSGAAGLLNIWSLPSRGSGQFFTTDPNGIAAAVNTVAMMDACGEQGIYARMTTVTGVPEGRGGADISYCFQGFWTDLDFASTGHKGSGLPPSLEAAQEVYDNTGLPPASVLVMSGGGLYHHVLLNQPLDITDAAKRAVIADLSKRWQAHIEATSKDMGFSYGRGVSDLARILRIPGTVNRKDPDNPRMATATYSEKRYSLEQMKSALEVGERRFQVAAGFVAPGKPSATRVRAGGSSPVGARPATAGAVQRRLDYLVKEFAEVPEGGNEKYDGRNHALNKLAGFAYQYAAAGQLDPDDVTEVFRATALESGLESFEVEGTLRSAERYGDSNPYTWNAPDPTGGRTGTPGTGLGEIVPPPADPMAVARHLVEGWRIQTFSTLLRYQDAWLRWCGPHWAELSDAALKSELYQRLEHAEYEVGGRSEGAAVKTAAWRPAQVRIRNLMEALGAVTHLPEATKTPSWLPGQSAGQSSGQGEASTFSQVVSVSQGSQGGEEKALQTLIACTNGLLDVGARRLLALTPQYFNRVSVPFAYDANAPRPERWLGFMNSVWPNDVECVHALQEWFGYVISGRTDLQKILYVVGPKRAGKGTIEATLTALVGEANRAPFTCQSLATDFGLATLVGKSLAVDPDVRQTRDGSELVLARLLSISGEDPVSVKRKYKEDWTGQIPARLMLMSNNLPNFKDPSGAITSRLVMLTMEKSFLGQEDVRLRGDIARELPGVLNWALEGLDRLEKRGRFTEPKSSEGARDLTEGGVSSVKDFVDEMCTLGPAYEIEKTSLYAEYEEWIKTRGGGALSSINFAKELYESVRVTRSRPKRDGVRIQVFSGITLASQIPLQWTRVEETMPVSPDSPDPAPSENGVSALPRALSAWDADRDRT